MLYLVCLGLFLPLLSFLYLFLFGDKKTAPYIGSASVLISFLCFAYITYTSSGLEEFFLFPWIAIKGLKADFILHIDHLSTLLTLIITGIGFLIHVYSIGYLEEENDLSRYFACLNFFIFSMLLLVLAGDLLLLYVGWEGVGLASYLLIGYWNQKPKAAAAATKAFVVNRIGDFGFFLGLLLIFFLFGTTNINQLTASATSSETITILTFLLLCGAVAKSAQLPLQVWLPDAMEGPTPVSALIHAATMVTAGVYLIARLHVLFLLSPTTMLWIGIIGASTSLFASIVALNQTDLKRVLAYSTISQLGLMFLATGVGAFYAAIFHLTTHAFMKALLFLAAGNVIHMTHGTTDMNKMGGLAKKLTTTHWLFLIGVLAMSGVPPLAAFFSKDLILEVEYDRGPIALFWVAVATSILTAIYLTRAYFLTFLGEPKSDTSHIHEAPHVMLTPVKILAVLAVVGGFLGFTSESGPFLQHYLNELGITPEEKEFPHDLWSSHATWLSILMAVGSVGFASILFTYFRDALRPPIEFFKKSFYIDEIYNFCFLMPYNALSSVIVNGFEPYVFLQPLFGLASTAQKAAYGLQRMQSGQIRSYAAWMAIGAVCLLIYLVA